MGKECLGKEGLHFIEKGRDELAINDINKTKSFWLLSDSFHVKNLFSLVTIIPNDANTAVSQNFKIDFQKSSKKNVKTKI